MSPQKFFQTIENIDDIIFPLAEAKIETGFGKILRSRS